MPAELQLLWDEVRAAFAGVDLILHSGDIVHPIVLDQLEEWNKDSKHELHGRLDLKHIGMSGHSFGAVTTQAVNMYIGASPPPVLGFVR